MPVVSQKNNIQQVVPKSGGEERGSNSKKILQAIVRGYKLRDTFNGGFHKHSQ